MLPNFDLSGFMSAEFVKRTKEVDMAKSAVADFFPDGAKKVFVVRGLTAEELAKVREEQNKDLSVVRERITEAVAQGRIGEQLSNALDSLVGLSSAKPPEYVFWFWLVVTGCVEPTLNIDAALRLAQVAPVEFKALADTILALTGMGQEAKKKQIVSGEIQ